MGWSKRQTLCQFWRGYLVLVRESHEGMRRKYLERSKLREVSGGVWRSGVFWLWVREKS